MQPAHIVALLGETVGGGELLVIFVLALLLFGAKRLPEIARSLGRTFEQLRHASDDFRRQILTADTELKAPHQPPPNELPSGAVADSGEQVEPDPPPEPPFDDTHTDEPHERAG